MDLQMNRILCFGLLIVAALPLRAQFDAETCPVNVLESLTSAEAREHFAQPFNQYESQLCYAHVAADLLSFRSGRSVSPIAAAVGTAGNFDREWSPAVTGEVFEIIQWARKNPVCTNAGFNSRLDRDGYNHIGEITDVECARDAQVELSDVSYTLFRDCRIPGRRGVDNEFKTVMVDAINESFGRSQPVGLQVFNRELMLHPPPLSDGPSAMMSHIMTLIGRRWNAEASRCEYVVRNSYGSDGCQRISLEGIMQPELGMDPAKVSCGPLSGFPPGTFSLSEEMLRATMYRMIILSDEQHEVYPEGCQAAASFKKSKSRRMPASLSTPPKRKK